MVVCFSRLAPAACGKKRLFSVWSHFFDDMVFSKKCLAPTQGWFVPCRGSGRKTGGGGGGGGARFIGPELYLGYKVVIVIHSAI